MCKQTFAIGCLSLSAVILLVGVFLLGALETRTAYASDMQASAGTYTLLTGKMNGTYDLVYVIDTRTEKLVVYRFSETSRQLERTDVLALDEAPTGKDKRAPMRP